MEIKFWEKLFPFFPPVYLWKQRGFFMSKLGSKTVTISEVTITPVI